MIRGIFSLISVSMLTSSLVAACSSSSSGSGNSACETYGKALLSYQSRCAGTVDPNHGNALVARYGTLCQAELSLPGIASSTSASLTACAAAIQGANCNTSFGQLDACNISTAGTLANGAACSIGAQCSSGSCSAGASGADAGTSDCGTCQPAIADGAACDQGGSCVPGDVCTFSSSGSAVCTPRPALGDLGASCTDNDGCKAPNHCLVSFSGGNASGACTAPVAAGGTCTEKTDCASGLICTGAATRTCTTPLAVGATCNGGDCGVGFACDANFKCIAVSFVAPGGTCDGDERFCSQGTCPLADSPTNPDPTGTCPTIIPEGQACDPASTSAQCDTFATCKGGKCTLAPATCK